MTISRVAPDHDELDYENLLIDTWIKGSDVFEYHLREEWEKAGRNGISTDDFRDGCLEILEMWQDDIIQIAQQDHAIGNLDDYITVVGEKDIYIQLYDINIIKDTINKLVKEKTGDQTTPAKPTPPKRSDFHLHRPIFVERFQEDHFNNLKQYFTPQEEFRKFVFGESFSFPINFNGTQNQFAWLFKKLKEEGEVHFPSTNEKTAIYLHSAFVFKKKWGKSLVRYFTGKTPINPDDCIDIGI